MDYQQMIDTLSPDTYRRLKRAVETGKWPDGKPLTPQQRDNAMHAVIAWGELHLPETDRVGYIDRGHKVAATGDQPQETILNWKG